MSTATDTKSELKDYIASLGIEYSAKFITQSQSRNATDKNPSLNWVVTIKKRNANLSTDYMQGIGHIPKNSWYARNPILRNKLIMENEIKKITEKGRYSVEEGKYLDKALPAPELTEVLYSLIMDSDVLNYSSFEDWAENTGYDRDSRKAEKIYNDCIGIALKLRSIIGNEAIEKLQVLFQDY